MNKTPRNHTFNKLEIQILRQLAKGKHSLSDVRKTLLIRPSLLTYNLKKLHQKGIIKTIERGPKKKIYFDNSKHASLIRELLLIHDHIKWENILSNLAIEILFQASNNSETSYRNFSKTTFWRHTRNLKAHGILESDNTHYSINPRFSILKEFLIEYQRFLINTLVRSVSESAVILWQKDFECLIRTPKNLTVPKKNFFRTATSRLHDFGIPILSDSDIYFYSKNKDTIQTEDVILHTLLIDRDNVRYALYSLLLLKKKWKRIHEKYLLREAQKLDLSLLINAMFQFLRTHGKRKGLTLPTWEEFIAKAKEYEVSD